MTNDRDQEPLRISLEDAKRRYDDRDVTILDVVDTDSYDQYSYQIAGAVRIKPEDISNDYSRLPQDTSVLTY